MEIHFITQPVITKSGMYAVALGKMPTEKENELYDAVGNIDRLLTTY